MKKSIFTIKKLDCPCEESLIRTKLQDIEHIYRQEYDLTRRSLTIYHEGEASLILEAIDALHLGAQLMETTILEGEELPVSIEEEQQDYRVLWTVLIINLFFFILELGIGWWANSMGLMADGLDMLADASVYGLSLWAIGRSLRSKKLMALIAGCLQLLLAMLGFGEVIQRFLGGETMPEFNLMVVISLLALIANTSCLWLLQRSRRKEAHIQASIIFSSNDVIVNLGVMIAGLLVWMTNSPLPDLIVGSIVFAVVSYGAWRILCLS